MTDEELDRHIASGTPALMAEWNIACAEQQRRSQDKMLKVHWTVLPTFWFTVISAVAAILAAYFAWTALKPSVAIPRPASHVSPLSSSPMPHSSPKTQ